MTARRRKLWMALLALVWVGWLAFIFSNSLRAGSQSSLQSGRVVDFVKRLLGLENVNETVIRKLGHFSEYFILGALSGLFLFWIKGRPGEKLLLIGLGLAACVTDECIQLTSPGRSCQITDMMIDWTGYLLALCLIYALCLLVRRRQHLRRTQEGGR